MRTVFKAVAEPVGTRTAYWNEVVGDRLAGLDIRLDDVPDARDELVVRDVGPLQVRVSRSRPLWEDEVARLTGIRLPGLEGP